MQTFQSVREKLEQFAAGEETARRRRRMERLVGLLKALERRDLDPESFSEYLDSIEQVIDEQGSAAELARTHEKLKRHLEKKHKLVVPDHYQTQWMALGMSVFGIPFGMMFALALDNSAFLAIGLPMGMAIGMSVGSSYDNKAREEGRVLEIPDDDATG